MKNKNICCLGYLSKWMLIFISLNMTVSIAQERQKISTSPARLIYNLTGDQEKLFSLPSDIASNSKQIAVLDGGNHRVVIFDKEGNYIGSFGGFGTAPGQMNYPTGIYMDDNTLCVADAGNNRVQIFSTQGKFIREFNVKYEGKSVRPIDLLIHKRTGLIVLTANQSHNVMVYTSRGVYKYQWGGQGTNQGQFRYPATLAETPDGRIAVVDVLNNRIQIFDIDGQLALTVSDWGVTEGKLIRPKGVTVDKAGNLFVSDSYMNVVQSFTDKGDFKFVLGNDGRPYDLITPVGMVFNENKLYVVEMKANRVSVFQF